MPDYIVTLFVHADIEAPNQAEANRRAEQFRRWVQRIIRENKPDWITDVDVSISTE